MKQGVLLAIGVFSFACLMPVFAQEQAASKEDLEEVKGALQGLSESASEYRGYVDALRKIKISGYMQTQWRLADVDLFPVASNPVINYPIGRFSGGDFPAATKNMFQVRRGRLKVVYDNVLTQFVVQIDAIQTGFTTKDAYVMVTEPWTKSFGMQMGIFDRPFGYELHYSSSNRETPERARIYQSLLRDERELGAEAFYAPDHGPLSFMRADIGVFNGSGPKTDEWDNFKDIIGHVSAQIPLEGIGGSLDLGVSGYFGNVRNNSKYLYTYGTLANGSPGFLVDSTSTNLGAGLQRAYYGIDAQFYIDVPSIGGAILRGEYITGKQPCTQSDNRSFTAAPVSGANMYQREIAGYLFYYIQNIGSREQLVVKYDVFDPNTKVAASDFTSSNTSGATGLTAADIRYSTLGLGFIHHWDDNVKFMFYYEIVNNEKLSNITDTKSSLYQYSGDVRDNVFTFRVQYKF